MLKGGIFLDVEDLTLNGGYGMRFRTVRRLVEAQGVTVLRTNAYMPHDVEREEEDRPAARRSRRIATGCIAGAPASC